MGLRHDTRSTFIFLVLCISGHTEHAVNALLATFWCKLLSYSTVCNRERVFYRLWWIKPPCFQQLRLTWSGRAETSQIIPNYVVGDCDGKTKSDVLQRTIIGKEGGRVSIPDWTLEPHYDRSGYYYNKLLAQRLSEHVKLRYVCRFTKALNFALRISAPPLCSIF